MLSLRDVISATTLASINSMAQHTAKEKIKQNEIRLSWLWREHSEALLEDRIRTQTQQYNDQFKTQGVK